MTKSKRKLIATIFFVIGIAAIVLAIFLLVSAIKKDDKLGISSNIFLLIIGVFACVVSFLHLIYKGRELYFTDSEIVEIRKGVKKTIKYKDIIDIKIIKQFTPTSRFLRNHADLEIITKKERITLVNVANPETRKAMILLKK